MSWTRVFVGAALLAASAVSQVTGVPFVNDYEINGFTSGSTSCTPVLLVCPPVVTATVTCAPNAPVLILSSPCPCVGFPANFPFPASPCVVIPPTPWIITNQTLDLAFGCPLNTLTSGVANGFGVFTWSVATPATLCGSGLVLNFATQAVILDPVCGVPISIGPILLTQAYDVTIIF